jgi:Protein of unknown function (DUF4236)
MGFRFQKRIPILPGVRINLSKSGASASLGPRGADVNIGAGGVTTNAGIPGTGLSYRSKLGTHGSWFGVVLLVGALAFWAGKHVMSGAGSPSAAAPATVAATSKEPGAQPTAPGIRYVHRAGSVVRDAPKPSGHTLKKEAKGAKVMLVSEDNGWAKVTDGAITGYMRASVLGDEPPQ